VSVHRGIQPLLVAVLVALASSLGLVLVVQSVLLGTGMIGPAVVIVVAAAALAVALALLLHRLRARRSRLGAGVLTTAVLVTYLAIALAGTQSSSVAMLRPEIVIILVSLATGAASALLLGGWWRVLGAVGVAGLIALALAPALGGI